MSQNISPTSQPLPVFTELSSSGRCQIWTCSVCTYVNSQPYFLCCAMCGLPKTTASDTASESPSSSSTSSLLSSSSCQSVQGTIDATTCESTGDESMDFQELVQEQRRRMEELLIHKSSTKTVSTVSSSLSSSYSSGSYEEVTSDGTDSESAGISPEIQKKLHEQERLMADFKDPTPMAASSCYEQLAIDLLSGEKDIWEQVQELLQQQKELLANLQKDRPSVSREESMIRLKRTQKSIRQLSSIMKKTQRDHNSNHTAKRITLGLACKGTPSRKNTTKSNTRSSNRSINRNRVKSDGNEWSFTKSHNTTPYPKNQLVVEGGGGRSDEETTRDRNPWAKDMDNIMESQQQFWDRSLRQS